MPYRKVKLSALQAREAEVSNLSLELLELEYKKRLRLMEDKKFGKELGDLTRMIDELEKGMGVIPDGSIKSAMANRRVRRRST